MFGNWRILVMMKLFGVGCFVQKPELRHVKDTCVCEFSLVFNERRKSTDERVAHFLDFVVWDSAAELIVDSCDKGDLLQIEAMPRQDKWVDKEGRKRSRIVFRLEKFNFIGPKSFQKRQQVERGATNETSPVSEELEESPF
jgi:single-stranded DNA-binding protein